MRGHKKPFANNVDPHQLICYFESDLTVSLKDNKTCQGFGEEKQIQLAFDGNLADGSLIDTPSGLHV